MNTVEKTKIKLFNLLKWSEGYLGDYGAFTAIKQ